MNITFVTCLFDLKEREGSSRRSIEDYLSYGRHLLKLPIKLYIFTEPNILPKVKSLRNELCPNSDDITVYKEISLEDTTTYQENIEVVRQISGWQVDNRDPVKDTFTYSLLTWTKFECLSIACKEDMFSSSHFGWVDFGLGHVTDISKIPTLKPFDKVRLLELNHVNNEMVMNRRSYYSKVRTNTAAGLMIGNKKVVCRLIGSFNLLLKKLLGNGIIASEENMLGEIRVHESNLFSMYYGCYWEIVCNFNYFTRNIRAVLCNIYNSISNGKYINAYQICQQVCKGVPGYLEHESTISPHNKEDLLSLYNFLLVCCKMMPGKERESEVYSSKIVDLLCGDYQLYYKSKEVRVVYNMEGFSYRSDSYIEIIQSMTRVDGFLLEAYRDVLNKEDIDKLYSMSSKSRLVVRCKQIVEDNGMNTLIGYTFPISNPLVMVMSE